MAPNIVPDKASVWYYVRGPKRSVIDEVYARLIKVANGAAMMTETTMKIEFLGGCHNTLPNKTLATVLHES
jgi:aminobenzoyl-glutamate utilization protein B